METPARLDGNGAECLCLRPVERWMANGVVKKLPLPVKRIQSVCQGHDGAGVRTPSFCKTALGNVQLILSIHRHWLVSGPFEASGCCSGRLTSTAELVARLNRNYNH